MHLSYLKLTVHLYPNSEDEHTRRGNKTYKTLEVLGPEHEFSIVNHELRALPIVDKVLKGFHGRIVNFVKLPHFTFGKELQTHVMEIRPNEPFKSAEDFENTMQEAVLTLLSFLHKKYEASLLGTGMHPFLRLEDAGVWPHRHRQIYEAYSKVFNLKRHGWLNIQSFQLNLPFSNEKDGVILHNQLANLCAYLPAIAASSPLYKGNFGDNIDNRLHFYKENQVEVPSVSGDIVPEYTTSFEQYRKDVIDKYSRALAAAGADKLLLNNEWVNSRGVIFRFDRKAVEIRILDEQECIKSDVALSCFIRATLRGSTKEDTALLPHSILVKDYLSIVKNGLEAKTQNQKGPSAGSVCKSFLQTAFANASEEEKKYLPIIEKRIERGNLSKIIRERIQRKAQKTDFKEAIIHIYSKLAKSLMDNQPYF